MNKVMTNAMKTLLLPVAVYLVFLIPNPSRFGSFDCLFTIFNQSIIPTVLGYAVCFGWISGVFDFTIGSRVIIAALIGGNLSLQFGLPGLIVGTIFISIVIGIVTGAINWVLRIPSLVVTLGLTMIYEILGQQVSGKQHLYVLTSEASILGSPPYSIIVLGVSLVLFFIIFHYTKFSYQARAVGSDEEIAKNMGIKVQWIKFLTFVVGGLFLGLGAILQISVSGSISSQVNLTSAVLLFKPLMGVMVALALLPICNLAIGILVGEFTINVIFVGLIASGLSDTYQNVLLGIFMLIVMLFSNNENSFKNLKTLWKKNLKLPSQMKKA